MIIVENKKEKKKDITGLLSPILGLVCYSMSSQLPKGMLDLKETIVAVMMNSTSFQKFS